MKGCCDKCGASFRPDYEGRDFGCELPYYKPSIKYIMSGVLVDQNLLEFTEGEEFLLITCSVCNYKWTEPTADK